MHLYGALCMRKKVGKQLRMAQAWELGGPLGTLKLILKFYEYYVLILGGDVQKQKKKSFD